MKDGDLVPPESTEELELAKCAIAFFWWTKEAQRLKRAAEDQMRAGDAPAAMATYQQHLQAVQSAVGWAKWSGL